jgi:N-acetylneuraminate synthase
MSVYVIAEIGINHNGDLQIAKDLIKIAKEAGANAVKFQKRDLNLVYTSDYLLESRESPWGNTQRDQKEGLEFSEDQYISIDSYCKDLGIDWFASAWDINSQKFLGNFDCKYNKVASAMIVYEDLLEEIAKQRRHTFISTGMSTIKNIDRAVEIFKNHECGFELMHCVSTYPMKDEDANLNVINTLRDRYNCDVGYSGHEVGLSISFAAAAMGITCLERHITLSRAMYGSDQSASIEPEAFRRLVGGVRKIEKAMGNGEKDLLKDEIPIAQKLRAHINI